MKKQLLCSLIMICSSSTYANFSASGEHAAPTTSTSTTELLAVATSIDASVKRPMRILITNDDGCQSEGTVSLQRKLANKGYDVWISAPATNQSGIGTAITFKPGKEVVFTQLGEKHFCFPGTPADALDFALVGVLKNSPPDLVISGVNDGPNTGMAQANSGTVGAAIRAMRHGYPAIAASIGLIPDELSSGLPSTKKYWPDSVDYVVNLVEEIAYQWTPNKTVLPLGSGLSINYPAWPKEKIKGVKYIGNEFNPVPQFFYELLPNGKARQVLNPQILQLSTQANDTGWLDQGYITYTILDGDWNGSQFENAYQALLKKDLLTNK